MDLVRARNVDKASTETMDAEKVTEVEMTEITAAEKQDDKDAEKGKMEGAKEAEKKSEEAEAKKEKEEANVYTKLKNPKENIYNFPMPSSSPKYNEGGNGNSEEDEEGEEANVYSKLNNPSENVYMAAPSSTQHNKDVYRNVRLYKRVSALFIIVSLLLLAVVLALAMKLYEVQSSQKCPNFSPQVKKEPSIPSKNECPCLECGRGWVKFVNSCYFISKERRSWQESREECQKMGGDLVVIKNEHMQQFLTKYWGMLYWIGLRYSEQQQWMWISNTTLTQSYWAYGQTKPDNQDSCALLGGQTTAQNNWHSNSCELVSQYICQKG